MLQTFFHPYVSTLHGAAWNIQQNMEGLGIASSNFVLRDPHGHIASSYWSPEQATIPLLGMLALGSLALAVLFVVSGYVLGRKRGALGAAGLLALPGCLNLVSLWPMLRYLPDRFDIGGTGALGAPPGFLPLLAFGVLLGWCLTILLADILPLGDRFGHLYDHLWCTAGLVAAVFFVADAGVGGGREETGGKSVHVAPGQQLSGASNGRLCGLVRKTSAPWFGLVSLGVQRPANLAGLRERPCSDLHRVRSAHLGRSICALSSPAPAPGSHYDTARDSRVQCGEVPGQTTCARHLTVCAAFHGVPGHAIHVLHRFC